MDARIAGALFGFALGAVGYIIVKYWILPIRDYRRLKAAIREDVAFYNGAIAEGQWNSGNKKRFKKTRKNISDLNDSYNLDIPVWYRIMLARRKESPGEAAKHLMALADIRDPEHAVKRLEKARAALLIK
jgi:hypothetical protein